MDALSGICCGRFAVVVASLLYLFDIEHRKLEDAMATITGIFYVVFFFIPCDTGGADSVWLDGMAHRHHSIRD